MDSDQQKVSYIIGRRIGGDFKKQNIDISFDEFFKGVRTSFNSEPSEIEGEEETRVMDAFQEKMKAAHEESTREAGKANKKLGEEFLAENKKVEGVQVTETGTPIPCSSSGTGYPTTDFNC